MKSAISRAPITASTGLSDSAQIVRGGSNLTTVGAVPYVSAPGVLNQDASNFFWDATNHRLGIGTNAPGENLSIYGATGNVDQKIETAGTGWVGARLRLKNSTSEWYIYNIQSTGSLRFFVGGKDRMVLTTAGVYGVGTDNNSPTGTLHVYDATASTGVTTLTVKAGAGQSTTNLQEWQNSSGTVLSAVKSDGGYKLGAYTALNLSGTTIQIASDGNNTQMIGPVLGLSYISTSLNASASTPALIGSGTWFTGGSATTTKPYLLIEPSGTTSTGWSTSGTGIGVNAASGFTGNLLDLQVAGTSRFAVDNTVGVTTTGNVLAGATQSFVLSGRSRISSSSNGNLAITNNAITDFGLLQFGGTTSSFPALKRSGAGLIARLADDSADTWVKVKSVITSALTVATLPASPTAGERAFVTDSNAVSFTAGIGAVVASGGSTAVPVVYDGTNWRIG